MPDILPGWQALNLAGSTRAICKMGTRAAARALRREDPGEQGRALNLPSSNRETQTEGSGREGLMDPPTHPQLLNLRAHGPARPTPP